MPDAPIPSRPHTARWPLIAAVLFTIALVAVVLVFTRPLPPRTVVMAPGPEDSIFELIGQRYAEIFARNGVKLVLTKTNGSVDNIALLNDPNSGVSVTVAESGITNQTESPHLNSLGTLFYEPFWFFSSIGPINSPRDIENKRVGLGNPGSATYEIGRNILTVLGLNLHRIQLRELNVADSGEALLNDKLDFVGMSQPFRSETVQRLLRDPRIEPISWARADAHVALRPYLSKLILPRGVADLAKDLPRHDVILVASKASLVVRDDLHPALQHLLLEAAEEVHSIPGVFHKAGEFPAAEPIDLPLSPIARDYYRNGEPFLQRYLPFWLAVLVTRLLVLLIPILGVAYPLFRLAPAIYGWSMRRRILRLYGELKFIEAELELGSAVDSARVSEQLDHLEHRADRMRVSTAFNQMLYTLKQHIGLVRQKIVSARPQATPESGP